MPFTKISLEKLKKWKASYWIQDQFEANFGTKEVVWQEVCATIGEQTHYHTGFRIRLYIAQYGNDQDRQYLLQTPWSTYWDEKSQYNEHMSQEFLMWDIDIRIKEALAEYGNDSMRSLLCCHPDFHVRMAVAKYGNDKNRETLKDDSETLVRYIVARYGNNSVKEFLKTDPDELVRKATTTPIQL